jgi:hypothetical protein
VGQAMRDFKEPYYEGPDCVCCHDKVTKARQDIIDMLKEQDSVCSDWVIALIEKEME